MGCGHGAPDARETGARARDPRLRERRWTLALARVLLPSSLARYTGGVTETEVEARDVRGVIRALEARYAGIGRELEEGMAVAVDAEIHQDDLFAAVGPDSEVCFLPRIGGG